ncbi:hypothetical protein BO85DRAFT_439749 [Aspergillus piperis CBS 112811]|uniref:Uncharacterized protein n=1 Tax=Aspergillus piperis CBS 112811 TaxID=1448313 RepID=A0A8G1R028_9EURO|nr:hypothetical protein BO85DRAFT_439749 [Aspergillus piperis CBS 112811]RAH56037.1 hypothetical protein BO85DRAFT_439749 [Aspergillus piperis CBS 112811]
MHAAVKDRQERERFLGKLGRRMVQEGFIDRKRAGGWVREALEIMELYVREWQGVWPGVEERGKMLQRILVENAQLFARWRVSPASKQFNFELDSDWLLVEDMRLYGVSVHMQQAPGKY